MKGTLYSWHMKFRFFEESKRVHFYFALTIRYMVVKYILRHRITGLL